MRHTLFLCLLLTAVLCFSGCGGAAPEAGSAAGGALEELSDEPLPMSTFSDESKDFEPYDTPPFADARFHPDRAEGNERAQIDVSAAGQGYVAVAAASDTRLKFQVIKDDVTYNYDMPSDGTPSVFPLQGGDGTYRLRVMENVVDSKYAELYSVTCEVVLEDAFQPFLRPSSYVPYSAQSDCVQKAGELAGGAADALGVVSAVYDFVCTSVTYDAQKAASVRSGYLPDPDETMRSGKGICFDYAALAAAMLRSQGIPTKMIFGYVSPNGLYHAWNMFYTAETGWITVSYEVRGDSWNRLDLTFSANGADDAFVGDGGNYTDLYFY